MTSFDFGAVVLVPFPFTDQSSSKQRPAVVISTAEYSRVRGDILVVAVTSQMGGEFLLTDWKAAGLVKPSVLKPVIATLAGSLVIRRLGTLSEPDAAVLREMLRTLFSG